MEEVRKQGNDLYREKDYEGAIGCYTAVLDENPDVVLALGNRSAAYLALKKYPEAERDARRALELDFGNEKYSFRLASALLEQPERLDDCIMVIEDAVLLHPDNTALKKVERQAKEKKKKDEAREKKRERMKSGRSGAGFLNSRSANEVGIFGDDLYCTPCDDDNGGASSSNPFAADGALIIETIPGASYTELEYTMLTHVKDIVKSIQKGGLSSSGILNNHFLSGKFKMLCDKEFFLRSLFPGFSKEALQSMPQNMRELLLWKELTLDLTKIARKAASVLTNVKTRGEKTGDFMDKDSEKTLCPQIAQEALAVELESAVKQLGKQISKVAAKVQLCLADPIAEQAGWDQLDDDVWPDLMGPGKLCVQEEYLGEDWAALVAADVTRFASREPMDDVALPADAASNEDRGGASSNSSNSTTTTDISELPPDIEAEVNAPKVPARIAWLESSYKDYPALTEAISKLRALPYELNKKQAGVMELKEPARGCVALMHYPPFAQQPQRYDNSLGATDSGIRITCQYNIVPSSSSGGVVDAGTFHHQLRGGLEEGKSSDGNNYDRQQLQSISTTVEADCLYLFQSTQVLNSRAPARQGYYVLCLYIHGNV
jgi:hypothetical protein